MTRRHHRSHNPSKRVSDHLRHKGLGWPKRIHRIRQIGPLYYADTFRLEIELIELYQPIGNHQHTKNWVHPRIEAVA